MRVKADFTEAIRTDTLGIGASSKWLHGSLGTHSRHPLDLDDDVEAAGATNRPDGQITQNLSSPHAKNISLSPSGNSVI
jgi:hypothetical protein